MALWPSLLPFEHLSLDMASEMAPLTVPLLLSSHRGNRADLTQEVLARHGQLTPSLAVFVLEAFQRLAALDETWSVEDVTAHLTHVVAPLMCKRYAALADIGAWTRDSLMRVIFAIWCAIS
jgi:hypothetical protein